MLARQALVRPESAAARMRRSLPLRNVQSLAMFTVALASIVTAAFRFGRPGLIGLFGLASLGVKVALSVAYRPASGEGPAGLRVAGVVPFYNEDPVAFRACLESLLSQSRPLDELWVIDDGSADDDCHRIAVELLDGRPGATVLRQANRGKRHAQGRAFATSDADVFCTVDSDTVLDREAVAEGLRPFADPLVQAVTGNVRVLNQARNLLTRLTALRYANAFLWERAAYSTVGSVVSAVAAASASGERRSSGPTSTTI